MTPNLRGLDVGRHRLPCPECNHKGPRDTALSVEVRGDGSAVWKCWRCGATGGQRGERARFTTISGNARPAPRTRQATDALATARAIWNTTLPLAGTLGAEYLELRHCVIPPCEADLRFHPALYCRDIGGELPALVARVSTVIGNRAVGVHRIWIKPGSAKALVKKRLGGDSGTAVCVRLWPAVEAHLGIAEGIETALAAAHRLRPMWSTVDAGQMAKFPLLAGLSSLTIFADYDTAGMKAATATQERYLATGRPAQIVRSRIPGEDFADVMLRKAQR